MLRRLGATTWKRLQRTSYVLVALIAVDVLLYQDVEQRIAAHSEPVRSTLVTVLVLQLAGVAVVMSRRSRPPQR